MNLASNSQVLFRIDPYRNLIYSSSGYDRSFANITVGVARRDYVRLIKRQVSGILEVSLPITNQFFTQHIIKKGLQINLRDGKVFKIPVTVASSSIVRNNDLFKYHDITIEINLNPGIYKGQFTLALDWRYELILFRHIKYSQKYKQVYDNKAANHWTNPLFDVFKVGLVGGVNFKRWLIYLKTGYERNPFSFKTYLPGYFILGFGLKLGTRPMKTSLSS